MAPRPYPREEVVCPLLLLLGALLVPGCGISPDADEDLPRAGGKVTFTEHIAPVVYEQCAVCHRPGESAPFSLLTYQDAKKHDREMAEVTESRFMPPWLPASHRGEFVGERLLSDGQIELFRRWFDDGAPQGDPAKLPPLPQWIEGWQLGEPDLVVEAPEAYILPADGIDIFRNLILPIPIETRRYVRAIELRPGNPRVVHHAVMRVDATRSSRLLAEEDEEPGYAGMRWAEAQPPEGHFLGWTPGRVPDPGSEERAWVIRPGSDLIVQLHMLPTGKPETIRPRAGLYFAEGPPTQVLDTIVMTGRNIDIPAGEKDHVVEDVYSLPIDLDLLTIYPHAHYLGRHLQAYAVLPDGTRRSLIDIPRWDFNWQDQYRYVEPVFLPAGTVVHMRFTYDNSSDNVHNPNIPPKRVTGGLRSSDEMATLSLEIAPRDGGQLAQLKESLLRQNIEKSPSYWPAHSQLGAHLLRHGDPAGAAGHLQRALEINPEHAVGLNNLGSVAVALGHKDRARGYYRRALELRPTYSDAHYNLGVLLAEDGRLDEAIDHYRRALEVRPNDSGTYNNLAIALSIQGRLDEAIPHYRRALKIEPDSAEVHTNLGNVLLEQRKYDEAIEHYTRALEIRPSSEDIRYNLDVAVRRKATQEGS